MRMTGLTHCATRQPPVSPVARCLVHLGGSLQETRVQIEDITFRRVQTGLAGLQCLHRGFDVL